ncbi:MAG: glutamate-5-semialdehyde dehydrogenase [Acidobacteria bacterium]|nr:glutamate-5-semialdehyde dehydrogenase [Acidobacteriota bacterium]
MINEEVYIIAKAAKAASRRLLVANGELRNQILLKIATELEERQDEILAANLEDQKNALPLVNNGQMAKSLFDRLKLDKIKLKTMIEGVRTVADLEDPLGKILSKTLLDDGLELQKVSCPLGVLAVIFESRPDAVTQISALAIKSGNAVILKGGREALNSNLVLVKAIKSALSHFPEIPTDSVSLVAEREQINALLSLDSYVDLVIPRGSNELVRYIQAHTRIPVLGHAEGICHIYVDKSANLEMAKEIVYDAKLQYTAACNSLETLLIHKDIAKEALEKILGKLQSAGVELRGCYLTKSLSANINIKSAGLEDWKTEYCAPILSIKIVDSLDEAIEHINTYGSGHTDSIITEDRVRAEIFLNSIDGAGVYHNASTRFADGFRYGFGAEVGISTSKLHARGPVGLDGLVSYKYKLYGSGQVVATYSGANAKSFMHKKL